MLLTPRIAALTLFGALAACGGDVEPTEGRSADTVGQEAQADDEPAPEEAPRTQPAIDLARAARPASSDGRTACHGITGFLRDADPAGRVVRAGPSPDAVELGRIPPPVWSEERGGEWPYEFDIVGSENGWLEINRAGFDEQVAGKMPKAPYSGRGWIAAGGVFVSVQSQTGFAEPSHDSAVLIDGLPHNRVIEEFGPNRVIACHGRWILADWESEKRNYGETWRLAYRPEAVVRRNPVILRAWVAGVCNIIETTCDGINGDFAETSRLDSND